MFFFFMCGILMNVCRQSNCYPWFQNGVLIGELVTISTFQQPMFLWKTPHLHHSLSNYLQEVWYLKDVECFSRQTAQTGVLEVNATTLLSLVQWDIGFCCQRMKWRCVFMCIVEHYNWCSSQSANILVIGRYLLTVPEISICPHQNSVILQNFSTMSPKHSWHSLQDEQRAQSTRLITCWSAE